MRCGAVDLGLSVRDVFQPAQVRQSRWIEDQHDRAVAKDRAAGIGADAGQRLVRRLDDDLLHVRHFVDQQAITCRARPHEDNEAVEAQRIIQHLKTQDGAQIDDG